MMEDPRYRKSFYLSIAFHLLLGFLLVKESSHQRPVLTMAKNTIQSSSPIEAPSVQSNIVKAVSIDNQEVMKAVNQLKLERANQLKAERMRQQALAAEVEKARKARLNEQQRLAKLKEESEKIAIARKKQLEEEKKHLQEIAQKKKLEEKRLEELKAKQEQLKKQQEEALRLQKLKDTQEAMKAKSEQKKLEKLKVDQEKLDKEKEKKELAKAEEQARKDKEAKQKQEAARALQAQQDAARKAEMAGEVNKYKALIVNAIGRHWILPENVNDGLSSQFRIRLAPDGEVLEVHLMRSSGDAVLDRSAQTAIYKASPLPVPADPATFELFRDISLTVRPENVRG